MRHHLHFSKWIGIVILSSLLNAPASVLYVDLNSQNPTPPYADWSTAATNIADAADGAVPGDSILVGDGLYGVSEPLLASTKYSLVVTIPVPVRSANGPAV